MTDEDSGAAITISAEELRLRFPRGDFTDTYARDLVASTAGSTAGDVRVEPWSEQRIAQWHVAKGRFERIGRRIAWVVRKAGRSPRGDGLVQRVAAWGQVPLIDPPKASMAITNCSSSVPLGGIIGQAAAAGEGEGLDV